MFGLNDVRISKTLMTFAVLIIVFYGVNTLVFIIYNIVYEHDVHL